MIEPTSEQLADGDGFVSVWRLADDSWRHGAYVTEVFRRESDGTFWRAQYRLSTNGETNELREGLAAIGQVEPHEVTTTVYRDVAEAEAG